MDTPALGTMELCAAIEREWLGEGRVVLRTGLFETTVDGGAAQARETHDVLQAACRIGRKFGVIRGLHTKPFSVNGRRLHAAGAPNASRLRFLLVWLVPQRAPSISD